MDRPADPFEALRQMQPAGRSHRDADCIGVAREFSRLSIIEQLRELITARGVAEREPRT